VKAVSTGPSLISEKTGSLLPGLALFCSAGARPETGMKPQTTFEQLLHVQRKLNQKKKGADQKDLSELETEKCRLWQKLNEENVTSFDAIVFEPLGIRSLRPTALKQKFIDETFDLWHDQPDWLLKALEEYYWNKDTQEGRFYKKQTYDAYLGIRNILVQNFALAQGPAQARYIAALQKPRPWLTKLESDLRSVGDRLEEIAPALQSRTVRILLLPNGEQQFVSDEPGEAEKLLKEAREFFPNAAMIQAADRDVLNSIKDRNHPNGAIILTRFWISGESLSIMATMVKMFNKDLAEWKINGSPIRRRGPRKLIDPTRRAGIELCKFLQLQVGEPDYKLAALILNLLPRRSGKKWTTGSLKQAFLRSGT